jgi:hypothetical protein
MGALKTAASLLARFSLCFTLIACLWIVSISYRIGPFDHQGEFWVPNNSGAFADSDGLFLAAALALLIGLLGLYRSGRISAVLMVLVSLLAITAIDHLWSVYGYFDDYKGVPAYVLKPAIAAVLICPLGFLFPRRSEASGKQLIGCWAALALTVFLLGTRTGHNMLGLQSMIGPTYMQNVFFCLLACEALRQARRWWLANRADLLLLP